MNEELWIKIKKSDLDNLQQERDYAVVRLDAIRRAGQEFREARIGVVAASICGDEKVDRFVLAADNLCAMIGR